LEIQTYGGVGQVLLGKNKGPVEKRNFFNKISPCNLSGGAPIFEIAVNRIKLKEQVFRKPRLDRTDLLGGKDRKIPIRAGTWSYG